MWKAVCIKEMPGVIQSQWRTVDNLTVENNRHQLNW